jgi:hypothetical protein
MTDKITLSEVWYQTEIEIKYSINKRGHNKKIICNVKTNVQKEYFP